jgi:hypothetical protein
MRFGRTPRIFLTFQWKTGAGLFGVAVLATALALMPALGQDSPRETADAAAATPVASAPATAKPDSGAAASDPADEAKADLSADAKASPREAVKTDPATDTNSPQTPSATSPKARSDLKGKTRAPYVSPTKFVPSALKGVAGQCDNLMRLATVLKAEVDKTTMDVLSLAVVRDANRIQELAHKMRDQRGSQ